MSYNQKPPGPSGSGMGGGPPNGPNNIPQVAKTFAGIQQQMQNLVHGQNAIPQSSQADINAFLQQQRIQNMLKQQQQFLQFQHQMQAQQQQQQQQHQQQQQQLHNMPGGGSVSAGPVGGPAGVGAGSAGSAGGAGGSGEPLALTRTPGAAELLNKTYQQQANGNPAANPTFNQLQQTLQALPTNFVQQLQAFQYQMQAKQIQQQQQHGGGQGHQAGGHGQQQQPVQGVPPPPPPTTSAMSHQQQQHQQHQQKHQQHQHQQQQNAATLSTVAAVQQLQQRYLSAAAAAASGNKISSATPPPPPPPLTNQMKPPNLPPNTQITPVTGANVGTNSMSGASGAAAAAATAAGGGGPHQKLLAGNTNTGLAKHQAPPPPTPSISLTPSKQTVAAPSVAHQQNKFMPPTNTGGKGGHLGHSQNLSKSTHGGGGGGQTPSSNTTSPNKTGTNADTVVATPAATASALKSPQTTPVQLTKQTPTVASTVGSKTGVNTTAGATSAAMVSPQTTTVQPSASNTNTTITTTANPTNSNTSQAKQNVAKSTTEDLATAKMSTTKSFAADKEVSKLPTKDGTKKPADFATTPVTLCTETNKKDTEKESKENKLEIAITPKTPFPASSSLNQPSEKVCNEVMIKTAATATVTAGVAQIESKAETTTTENNVDAVANLNKTENHSLDPTKDETDKKSIDAKKLQEKNKPSITEEKSIKPVSVSSQQETFKKQDTVTDDKKSTNPIKKSNDEIKIDKNEETTEIEKKPKSIKIFKIGGESSITKDTFKLETETEKLNTATETKSSTITTSSIAVASNEKADVNVTNSLETLQKNDKQPIGTAAVQQINDKKELPILSIAEKEKSTDIMVSLKADAVKELNLIDKEEPPKHNKTSEKSESIIPVKAVTTTKTNNDDTVRETTESAQKEIVAAAATPPVKKLGRLTKVAKSKIATASPATVAAATVVASKTPETQLEEKPSAVAAPTTSARVKRKSKTESSYVFDTAPSTPKDDDLDRKSKRHRLKTILYQSPLPELAFITKLSASEASNSPKPMSNEDRLIVFYKNEYMAVRNSEGTFYLCQTMQNVYRTSPRISIRWLSEDAKDNNVYIPDFYDHTDIECVLTTVELKRIDKGHLRLPKTERIRIENILKKAIDVEKGIVPRPDLTEENPDGLDISLYKDESQIEKKSSADSGGIDSVTPSTTTGRKSRKGHTVTASSSSSRKSTAAATPSTSSAGNKRKRGVSLAASTITSNSRKSPVKKRKTLLKRKKKMVVDLSDDEDDDETSDDYASDTEYKPTQKRSSLNTSAVGSKTTPRAQRSPLAKARAASPITPTTSRSKNVPQKTTPTPSTSKVTRGERAAKRKSIIDAGSSEEYITPVKKPMTSSTSTNNASKTNSNATTTPIKKSHNDSKTLDSTNMNTNTTTALTIPNASKPAASTNSLKSGNNGVEDSAGGAGGGGVGVGGVDGSCVGAFNKSSIC